MSELNKSAVDMSARISEYLQLGGLFNPEHMEHDKVRDLLMDCRTAFDSMSNPIAKQQVEQRMCSVCAGSGTPVSGLECVCGGKGTEEAEITGLRLMVIDLEKRLEQVAKSQASGEVISDEEIDNELDVVYPIACQGDSIRPRRLQIRRVVEYYLQHQRRDGLERLEKIVRANGNAPVTVSLWVSNDGGITLKPGDGKAWVGGPTLESALAQYEATQKGSK